MGGVCHTLARRSGRPLWALRAAMVGLVALAGVGLVVYAIAWLVLPPPDGPPAGGAPAVGLVQAAAGAGLLGVAGLLALRELDLWPGDAAILAPLLAIAGALVLWHHLGRPERRREGARSVPWVATLVGLAMVLGAALVALRTTDLLGPARQTVMDGAVVTLGILLLSTPLVVALGRRSRREHRRRLREQGRAEMASQIHDSVLQTLAMIHRRADRPDEVRRLARGQEREVREWLHGPRAGGGRGTVAGAIEEAAHRIERDHGVVIEVVGVGRHPLDDGGRALADAAREAMLNAARFAPGAPVSVYVEADGAGVRAYVRDRGPGFDPAAIGADRRGVRESIIGRMERHGGRAAIHSGPEGTEVELILEGGAAA